MSALRRVLATSAASAAAAHARIAALASQRGLHQAFSWFHLNELQLRRWQLAFLAIPAPPFLESDRAAWFLERFSALGLHNPHLDAAGNALAELPGALTHPVSPVLLLSAHLDTVFPAGTACTPVEDGPRILGPGACDNGAGLAALLAVAAALQHAQVQPPVTVLFAANVGEEGEGDLRGMRHLFSSQSPYFQRIHTAIALEGSGSATVVDRALGSRRLRVTLTGPGGHSWADAGRPNPILALSAALLAIAAVPLPSNPRTTLNIGTLHAGTSVNSIPAAASADLDLRSTSSLELDRLELSLLQILAAKVDAFNQQLPPSLPVHLSVERIGDRAAGTLPHASPLFTSLRAVDRHLNITTEPHIGSTDANLPLSLNVPALAIGAGGTAAGIHTLQECYDPTGRDLALRRILLLLLDVAGLLAAGSSAPAE